MFCAGHRESRGDDVWGDTVKRSILTKASGGWPDVVVGKVQRLEKDEAVVMEEVEGEEQQQEEEEEEEEEDEKEEKGEKEYKTRRREEAWMKDDGDDIGRGGGGGGGRDRGKKLSKSIGYK